MEELNKDIRFSSMYEAVRLTAEKYPHITALEYMGEKTTYKRLIEQIEKCAEALSARSIKKGDRVTLCMPNCPQAVIMFYALNRLGAVANMIHPLSAENEIAHFVNFSESKAILIPDMFYHKLQAVSDKLKNVLKIVTGMADTLNPVKRFAYRLMSKTEKIHYNSDVISWKEFLSFSEKLPEEKVTNVDVAAILYSGGTTGTTKGIMLTSGNFNACAMGTRISGDCIKIGNKMLAIMPIFHGFGLGVCVHTALTAGCTSILVPRFTPATFVELIRKHRPNYIAGVPTLFEAMLRIDGVKNIDLSCLEGVFCGGDSLSPELKDRFDKFLKEHGSKEQIREGYGLTECVTASCLTPRHTYKKGSIGLPFPDTFYKIADPKSNEALPPNEEGEILISGPLVMKGYLNNPEETAKTLKQDEEGRIWLHTGDLGSMDEEGFVYFKQRLKRVIITSGFNVYPSQAEAVIDSHEAVRMSCIIGVKDEYRGQRIKAFISLKDGFSPSDELTEDIKKHCERNLAKYAMPREFEYRDSLPVTLVGKVAYRVLEEEENNDGKS